jgi:hypothetical protein
VIAPEVRIAPATPSARDPPLGKCFKQESKVQAAAPTQLLRQVPIDLKQQGMHACIFQDIDAHPLFSFLGKVVA